MRLDSAGNLGLGVTPSAWGGSSRSVIQFPGSNAIQGSGSLGLALFNNAYNNGTNDIYLASGAAYKHVIGTAFQWFTAPSGTAGNAITFTQAMTLDASGNLGIGTSSPGAKLEVNQAATAFPGFKISGSNSPGIQIVEATGVTSHFVNDSAGVYVGSSTSYPLVLRTNNTERARIDQDGNLLVGTTTNIRTSKFVVGGNIGTGTSCEFDNSSSNAWIPLAFHTAGTLVGYISSNTTTTTYNITSDYRLKTNIVNAEPASDLIDAIQVRQYDWKSDGSHQRYGFVAQELITVAPEAVHQPADPEEMMAVDYSKLVPMLVKEIQSLRKRLAAAGI
jgi:hypothetical protein